MAFELNTLPAAVLVLLLGQLPRVPLSGREWQDIEDVARAHRDPVLARAALQAWVREASHCPLSEAQQQAHQQLAAWAFQNKALATTHGDAVSALRQAAVTLLEQVNIDVKAR